MDDFKYVIDIIIYLLSVPFALFGFQINLMSVLVGSALIGLSCFAINKLLE